jgi:phosphoribosylamine--glycine ligase
MRILIVGSGGREHALADALSRENTTIDLLVTPGNPGIATIARTMPIAVTESLELAALAEREKVDLVVIGPEAPLADGIVDLLRNRRIPVFGPTREAATIETSKAGTKALMLAAGVPTARAETHKTSQTAKEAVRLRFGAPVVIKASGLAAGKGVIICPTVADADKAIEQVLDDRAFGDAGAECLVEAFMTGEELSLFAVTDGSDVLCMLPVQDHKRLCDGDEGPNTGGMGAYAPVSIGTHALIDDAIDRIFHPTLHALRKRNAPFTGLLYAGLMLTEEGPQVIEFNCRFGDPETQAILPLLDTSLLDPMMTVARGGSLRHTRTFQWKPQCAVSTVIAAPGYPELPRTGSEIHMPASTDALRFYHAGTARRADGALVTSGGRVITVTGIASTFDAAQAASRAGAAQVEFDGAQYRRDIGWREAGRQTR